MKKFPLPCLASAVLGALFFLAACIVLAVRLVRGEAGLTDAAALVLTACGGDAALEDAIFLAQTPSEKSV